MAQMVSITIQDNPEGRPIIESIKEDNPGVDILQMPGAVKIDHENRLIVKAETVSAKIGREWDPQEIHLTLVSMAGNLDEEDEYFALSWN